MSAHVLANEGVNLVKANKYHEGIEKLTQALKVQKAPMWLIERSKAYLRTNDFELALHDAEQALSIAFSRANRDLMVEAQIRRAVTLFRLQRYADTDVCAFWAIKLLDGAKASEDDGQQNNVDAKGDYAVKLKDVQDANLEEARIKKDAGLQNAMAASGRTKDTTNRNLAVSWRVNALTAMEKLDAGAPGRKVTVVKYPTPSDTPPVRTSKVQTEKVTEINDDEPEEDPNKPKIPRHILTGEAPSAPGSWGWDDVFGHFKAEHKKHDIRTDWYETDAAVNVSLFVKNLPKDSVKVDAQEQSVTITPIASIPTGSYTLNLREKIKPDETTYTVKSMKIELVLKKVVPGKWRILHHPNANAIFDDEDRFIEHAHALGFEPSAFSIDGFGGDLDPWYSNIYKKLFSESPAKTTASSVAKQAQVVPVTSKTAPLASAPAYPTSSKSGPKNWDSMDLDADEDKDDDNVDDFFKKIYKDADPDTRRAMMKSYVESNGTSLSTSWSEAASKNYKTEPPEGAEAKKWDA